MMSLLQRAHVNARNHVYFLIASSAGSIEVTLRCSVHVQTVALNLLVAGVVGSTEQDTTRGIMTCLKVVEEVDNGNPDGIALLFRWNTSGKDVSYTVSEVQRLSFSNNLGERCLPHSDVAHSWEGGMNEVLLHVSCFSCNLDTSQPTPSVLACFLPSCFPIGSSIDTLDSSAYPLGSMHIVQQHSIKSSMLYLTCH